MGSVGHMLIEIFIHPTCPTCNTLLRLLRQWGFIDKVRIIDVSRDPYPAFERGVRSVPSIFIDGKLVYAGIVDFERLRRILEEGLSRRAVRLGLDELLERFFRGVLDSVATALWLYLTEDCASFFNDPQFTAAMMGIADSTFKDEMLAELRGHLEARCGEYVGDLEEHFLRVISKNFARELYWLHGRRLTWGEVSRLYTLEVLAHWAMVRAALGRVGLRVFRLSDGRFRSKIEKLRSFLESNFDRVMVEVEEEQEALKASQF